MDVKICPKCKTENPIEANYCRKCRYKFPQATKQGKKIEPAISYFRIRESQYVKGSRIHIEWGCENFTKVEIDGNDVTPLNIIEYDVGDAAELHLTAFNDYDQIEETLKVIPTSLPVINRFVSSNYNIIGGNKVKLSWSVDDAVGLSIIYDDNEIDVTSSECLCLSPLKNTEFTLVAYSADKNISIEKKLSINVFKEVIINDFSSNKMETIESQPIDLHWNIENADRIIIYPDNIDVTNHTSLQLYPCNNTTYRLVASNTLSEKEMLLTVGVRKLPRIDTKFLENFSNVKIPEFDIDFSQDVESLKETEIDRWVMSPLKQPVVKKLEKNSILKQLKKIVKSWI